jgi:uncharacterized protein with HEPN domain
LYIRKRNIVKIFRIRRQHNSNSWRARRLRDIPANVDRIRRHTSGMTAARFLADEKTQDAVERCLERISQAARKIGDGLDAKYPDVAFHKLRQLGGVLRHGYDDFSADLAWISLTERLDTVEDACRRELAAIGPVGGD